ncbi:MAG: alpha-galactosidase [Candidatus Izemoplasmatales bacterium]
MIRYLEDKKLFHLITNKTSYVFEILPTKHLGHLFYGSKLVDEIEPDTLRTKFDIEVGNQVLYHQEDRTFNLNTAHLELSTYGKGDFRAPMCHFRFNDGSRLSDFLYTSHEILEGKPLFEVLPESKSNDNSRVSTLKIVLVDEVRALEICLYYSVFEESDVITRRITVMNNSHEDVTIEKASSMNLDMCNKDYELMTLDGAWIRERMVTRRPVQPGIYTIDSKKGVSSNDHNPFIALLEPSTSEEFGRCYGFSLVYSGDFEASVELSPHQNIRVLFGINSFDFYYNLKPNNTFVSPEVAMTFSNHGLSELSHQYHEFVKKNIIPKQWQNKDRPIVLNNWEATYFDFNEKKILKLAKAAKQLGIELFVLDDGWFGNRFDDHSSLGDFYVNQKKLPHGLEGLSAKINKLGLSFGLWVEPEMISKDSDLYRSHPDWALSHPGYQPSEGRNQLVLDLSSSVVRTYLFESLSRVFESGNIAYVKWDMNRNLSDLYSNHLQKEEQGSLNYRYYLGLTELLTKLTQKFPNILFESCASGGNRFDLGMLCFMPQTWTSDNTDGLERVKIQYGTSIVYPLSTISAHVSEIPNQQTIRQTPLETRFNTAMFGLLGYELDVTKITPFEKKVIKKQIAFYKQYRSLLQFGTFERYLSPFEHDEAAWAVTSINKETQIYGLYQLREQPNNKLERFEVRGIDPAKKYHVRNKEQYFNLSKFGHLVHHALPIKINANGLLFHLLKNRYLMPIEKFDKSISGEELLYHGFAPYQPFIGSGYTDKVRLMGDYESRVYILSSIKEDNNA